MIENAEKTGAEIPFKNSLPMRNVGQPIRLSGVNLCGVSKESASGGERVSVWTRLSMTSDEPLFHHIADNLIGVLSEFARKAGRTVNLRRADVVLLVARPDGTADLWVDAAAVSLNVAVKRGMRAGAVVFENDIADIRGMGFPLVEIGPKDRILVLFREDWRFALFFDFNPEGDLRIEEMERSLGALYRNLKYRHIYDALSNEEVFDQLLERGWFPFVEIIGGEFKKLMWCYHRRSVLSKYEEELRAGFNKERLERMLSRWLGKAHFASRKSLLEAAVKSFFDNNPVATIKIVLTEIEGILAEAHYSARGHRPRLKELLQFAIQSAEAKAGSPDTLLLSAAFARYLANYTFANFDPSGPLGSAGSRHAVAHGAAEADSYTQTRALQALLTLDQLAFYT